MFNFTSQEIADSLISAQLRGIDVNGIMEKSQNSKYSVFNKLNNSRINVTWDTNPANMHHKVFIIDGTTLITGSTNPSNNGLNNNDENIVIIELEEKMKLSDFISHS